LWKIRARRDVDIMYIVQGVGDGKLEKVSAAARGQRTSCTVLLQG
jgi:hypothetical protein